MNENILSSNKRSENGHTFVNLSLATIYDTDNFFQLRKEWKPGAIVFAVLGLVKPVYYIARIVLVNIIFTHSILFI